MEARRLLTATRRDFLRLLAGGTSIALLDAAGCGGERPSMLDGRDAAADDDAARDAAADDDGARGAEGAGAADGATNPDGGRRMERIGLQLYTVRELLAADFDGTLARVAAIGYTDVETAGSHGRTPDEMRAALQRHRLRAPSAHVEYTLDDAAWARTLDDAARTGHAWVVVPWLPEGARDSRDAWRRTADRLNRMGATARAGGLRFAYHNHDFEFTATGGDVPYDLLLAETDPALVAFELDVYWMTKAGHDPVTYLAQHPQRFAMTHLKDSAGAPSHPMTDVGSGTIDFVRVLAACERAGVAHHFVEHDQPTDALRSIEASYRWLRALHY